MELTHYLAEKARLIDKALDDSLPHPSIKPESLHRAMRYSLFVGGKRLRPILCIAACEICGGEEKDALPAAVALECVHTYSLIHDDLPCLDNDNFRRGCHTTHKVFGEAIALLAGDALLTLAFEILAQARPTLRYAPQVFLSELSHAAGSRKLIAGQVADLEGEGKKCKLSELRFIHQCKTSAMIVVSLRLGAMTANATPSKLASLTTFGANLGLAFQIVDDILDVTQTTEWLGKSAGKDTVARKATFPAYMGVKASRREAARLTHNARRAIRSFGRRARLLKKLALFLLGRKS
ncbi:MAG: polyprenyl synthetase family protein [Candidatus Xiphinematobacter sp.]|nr:MAG: polyprenyl synthetase family protein [Candidatus Xiphinematobacter sp.]